MKLINTKAKILSAINLSPTAREISVIPETPLDFIPGMFVNIFIEHEGKTLRRAYSISSDPQQKEVFTVSARLLLGGEMSPIFWSDDIVGKEIKVMGPMGFNTLEKITKKKVYLFAFGIGAGVIKSIAHGLLQRPELEELHIVTGNRDEEELLYRDVFKNLAKEDARVDVMNVLSKPKDPDYGPKGHVPDFVGDLDLSNASIYACGSTKACESLKEKIENGPHKNYDLILEAFG